MSISYQENRLQVHFRFNKHGYTGIKPPPIRMDSTKPQRKDIEEALESAKTFVINYFKEFNKTRCLASTVVPKIPAPKRIVIPKERIDVVDEFPFHSLPPMPRVPALSNPYNIFYP